MEEGIAALYPAWGDKLTQVKFNNRWLVDILNGRTIKKYICDILLLLNLEKYQYELKNINISSLDVKERIIGNIENDPLVFSMGNNVISELADKYFGDKNELFVSVLR
ncbi:hypothetical protein P4S72_28540 [Vibrio sp. PP-XX7]